MILKIPRTATAGIETYGGATKMAKVRPASSAVSQENKLSTKEPLCKVLNVRSVTRKINGEYLAKLKINRYGSTRPTNINKEDGRPYLKNVLIKALPAPIPEVI